MMLSSLAIVAALSAPADVEWSSPDAFVQGSSFPVEVTIHAPVDGLALPQWLLGEAAFAVDGSPLGERGAGTVRIAGGATLSLAFDLAPHLDDIDGAFELTFGAGEFAGAARPVEVYELAPDGLAFWGEGDAHEGAVATEDLANYMVLLQTTQGNMLVEFWPDVAPNHVRNFLDLSYTGFYDGLIFHRVFPGFMIQGGCPLGTGTGKGPRTLRREFNDRKHVRGVLSMARTPDPDSATSQFFIMHGANAGLDGQYSAFGNLVSGDSALDAIANAPGKPIPGAGGNRPDVEQRIERALVIVKPE